MRSLVLHIARTDFNEDARLFRVRTFPHTSDPCVKSNVPCQVARASLEPYAEMVRLDPQISNVTPPPPEFAGRPSIHCIFYIEEKDSNTGAERARGHSWCITDLQLVCSRLEKDYSRAIAKQVIPLLASDINGLKKPEEVRLKYHLMIEVPDIVQTLLDVSSAGAFGDGGGELFRQLIEQLLRHYLALP